MGVELPSNVEVTLVFDREDGRAHETPIRSPLVVTPELADALSWAAALGKLDPPPVSFTSLLAGIMVGSGETASWLRALLTEQGVDRDAMAKKLRIAPSDLEPRSGHPTAVTELPTTQSARQALEHAQSIMASVQGSVLDVHHVAAAYPVMRDWHEESFASYRIDRLAWCRALGARMAAARSQERWYWRSYANRASPVPLTSFSPDVYTDEDLLGIDRTVDALALLMASARTVTPLSIGVFGPWGSGKSFFMSHLQKRIDAISARESARTRAWADARTKRTALAADVPLYFRRIAQIKFNAWHYNEANLVASLCEQVFRSLNAQGVEKAKELQRRKEDNLKRVAGARVDLERAKSEETAAEQKVTAARVDLAAARDQVDVARRGVGDQVRALEEASAGFEKARGELEESARSLTEGLSVDPAALVAVAKRPLDPVVQTVRTELARIGKAAVGWRDLARKVASGPGLVVVALCVAAPAIAWVADWASGAWATAAGLAASGVALAQRWTSALRTGRAAFEKKLAELEAEEARALRERTAAIDTARDTLDSKWKATIAELRGVLEEQRTAVEERERRVASAATAVAERTQELDVKVEERSAAERKLRDAEEALKEQTSARKLEEFIDQRNQSDRYSKELGLLALARRDFEDLSKFIDDANRDWLSPAKADPEPPVSRIILYIDDLDRCNEDTVMRVLEAVHLLLAFREFACVVAVDPRWIERFLQKRNKDLFGGAAAEGASAADYLEKIFQIPIWTTPIEARQRAAMVRSLLGPTAAPTATKGAGARSGAAIPQIDASPRPDEYDGFKVLVSKKESVRDPLLITSQESAFIDRVAPLLSDRPRALKRFVNSYRLLKASLPDIDRQDFVSEEPDSPFRICLAQLAFFTGHPRLAPTLVAEMERAAAHDQEDIDGWFDALAVEAKDALRPAFELVPDRSEIKVAQFRAWLPDTSRYLFHRKD